MKTRTTKRNRINVVTLGCSKNVFDSEIMMAQLKANNFSVEHESANDADIVIINTCGFIENAKQESIDNILGWSGARRDGKIGKLYVTGCLSERYKDELSKEIREVDAWFGTRDLPRLLKTLKADYKHELIGERLLTTPSHYAYFKIAEGCDRPCSFCAIPLMRGKHVSTPMEALIDSAKKLAAGGTRELILIAQDLTYYGLDLYGRRSISELLQRISEIDGIDWIRLHYAFPSGFPMDLIDEIRDNEKVCKYLDMPVQHVSYRILKSMRRGLDGTKTEKLIETIRDRIPEIALRTTLITGYPGETEEEFEMLYSWVEKIRFERLGCFTYSHEENTHAFALDDDVPAEIKKQRADAIMEIQGGISLEQNKSRVGKTFKVMVDKVEGGNYVARTEFDSPDVDNEVLIPQNDNYLRIGDFAEVKITGAENYDLFAEPV